MLQELVPKEKSNFTGQMIEQNLLLGAFYLTGKKSPIVI